MKKQFSSILATLGFLALLASCQKAPELTLTGPASVELTASGGSKRITFTANRDWTAHASDSWISVTPSSGMATDWPITVSIVGQENTTYDDRNGVVTISMDELSQKITVSQPANLGIVLPTKVFDLQSDATSIEVEVQANVPYSVSTSENWIQQTETKGLTSKKLTFSIEENTAYDSREGKITIKSQDGSVQEQVISVRQAQKNALQVEKTSYSMPYGGGEIEIKVESNVSYDVRPDVDWIHVVGTKALSSSTIRLMVDENMIFETRKGKVVVQQKNGSISHTIDVTQAAHSIENISFNTESTTLMVGDIISLFATIEPEYAPNKNVKWSSSDTNVATVNEGMVTAKAIGSATITVTTEDGNKTATCIVTVTDDITQFVSARFLGFTGNFMNGLYLYGDTLIFVLDNDSQKTIYLEGAELIDGVSMDVMNRFYAEETLEGGYYYRIVFYVRSYGIRAPIVKFVYTYEDTEYVAYAHA